MLATTAQILLSQCHAFYDFLNMFYCFFLGGISNQQAISDDFEKNLSFNTLSNFHQSSKQFNTSDYEMNLSDSDETNYDAASSAGCAI